MQQSVYAPNLYADGSSYLKGFLGLSCRPSDKALANKANYEAEIHHALKVMFKSFSSSRIITEIAKRPSRTIVIRPRAIPKPGPDEDAESAQFNATTTPDKPRDGILRGEAAPEPDEDVYTTKTMGTGAGSNVVITINPGVYSDYGKTSPAYLGRSDDVLAHELVHGLSQISGRNAATMGGPAGYGNLEEFSAVVVANVYRSEKQGAAAFLRSGHDDSRLPASLSNSRAFYAKYKVFLDQVYRNLPGLSRELSAGTGIAFNPFIFCRA